MDIPRGFIPLPPRAEPQAVFRPLLDGLRRTLARPPFEWALHSVYLYGSVTHDETNARHSDLDLTLVLRDPPSPELAMQLETVCLALQMCHPEVSKIDFDIGHPDQARGPVNRDSWNYWLKHCCRHLWGEDLASALPPLRPAKAIALAPNGDYAQVLEDYARHLKNASSGERRCHLQQEAAEKLIHSSDILHGETKSAWPETPEHYLALFCTRHPGQALALKYFKAVLDGQVTDPTVLIERLRVFGVWMQRQAQLTETVVLSIGPTGSWHSAPCACIRVPG